MDERQFKLLAEILSSPSPSGYEGAVRKIVRRELEQFCEEVTVDVMGNIIAKLKQNDGPKVVLDAHMDQVGFQITYITEKGFLYFTNIGGIDPHMTAGQRVTVWGSTSKNPIRGVIGRKPIHKIAPDERTKVVPLKKQYIDIGAKSKIEAEEHVDIGDPVTFAVIPERLGISNDLITTPGADDRIGVFAIIEAMRELANLSHQATVYATISTQEEIGLRGAATACYRVNPDVALAIDASHAVDYPGMCPIENYADASLGNGPLIFRGAGMSPRVVEILKEVAGKNNIPYQKGSVPLAPTNSQRIQITREGVAVGAVGIPSRYMHTPSEVVALSDIEKTSKLIIGFVQSLKVDSNFIPKDE